MIQESEKAAFGELGKLKVSKAGKKVIQESEKAADGELRKLRGVNVY